ncbi:unnamed protein product, partial [Sphacelaria rigidula]
MELALSIKENPLKWWVLNVHKYPFIAHVARNALAVLVTSGPLGRASCQSGQIVTQRRNRLINLERLETPMFL